MVFYRHFCIKYVLQILFATTVIFSKTHPNRGRGMLRLLKGFSRTFIYIYMYVLYSRIPVYIYKLFCSNSRYIFGRPGFELQTDFRFRWKGFRIRIYNIIHDNLYIYICIFWCKCKYTSVAFINERRMPHT